VQFEAKKTEAVLFTRKRGQELRNQIQRARIMVGGHSVSFNCHSVVGNLAGIRPHDEGALPDTSPQSPECRISGSILVLRARPSARPGLSDPGGCGTVGSYVRSGTLVAWSKDWCTGMQRMINRQARTITGMPKTTPMGLLNREAGLAPAEGLLKGCQLRYTARLLGLPDDSQARSILPVSFREGDQHARYGEHTPGNRLWAEPHARDEA
jgi:hypothetical protein